MTVRITVMASGRGSNFVALAKALNHRAGDGGHDERRPTGLITHVVSDRADAGALDHARALGIETRVVPFDRRDRAGWNRRLVEAVREAQPDWVVLAGFMRVLDSTFVTAFADHILNVHPSLLPSFPGTHAPAQALAAGVRMTGCTVHLVDAGVDTGTILAQSAVPVLPSDDEDALHARIQKHEHRLLPAVMLAIVEQRLTFDPRPTWSDACWPDGIDSPCMPGSR